MAKKETQYAKMGIDARKADVREAFSKVIDNDFPGAFVNIVHDPEYPGVVHTTHGDGDGSKSLQRYVHYLETGDETTFCGMVDDGIGMNMGDIAACGFVDGFTKWTDILNIHNIPDVIPKKVIMNMMAKRFGELKDLHNQHGFMVKFLGGETADLPDQVSSSTFDVTVDARASETDIITGNVQTGDLIYGFASDGQADWEDGLNSGLMSNGLTLAGTCLGWQGYNRYSFLRLKNPFTGKFKVGDTDQLLGDDMTVFGALLSPTRQWSILIRLLVQELKERNILHMLHGISMNTGGGATKIGHVGSGILYMKERMPTPPPIFQLIQREGEISWEEMYEAFNCGVGIDVVGQDHDDFADVLKKVAIISRVKLYNLGYTTKHDGEGNKVVVGTDFGTFDDY